MPAIPVLSRGRVQIAYLCVLYLWFLLVVSMMRKKQSEHHNCVRFYAGDIVVARTCLLMNMHLTARRFRETSIYSVRAPCMKAYHQSLLTYT
jgi:hypothetical protein